MTIHICKLEYGHDGYCIPLCGEDPELYKSHPSFTKSLELCNCDKCIKLVDPAVIELLNYSEGKGDE